MYISYLLLFVQLHYHVFLSAVVATASSSSAVVGRSSIETDRCISKRDDDVYYNAAAAAAGRGGGAAAGLEKGVATMAPSMVGTALVEVLLIPRVCFRCK